MIKKYDTSGLNLADIGKCTLRNKEINIQLEIFCISRIGIYHLNFFYR